MYEEYRRIETSNKRKKKIYTKPNYSHSAKSEQSVGSKNINEKKKYMQHIRKR